MKSKIKTYAISILIPLAVGTISALLTMGNMDIYDSVATPPLSPPGILFPIVWTLLYILMGVSAARICLSGALTAKKQLSMVPYGASLFFNFFWSIFFFNLQWFFFSFLWLLMLLIFIILTIVRYRKIDRTAAYLQIPYAVWVTFAGYLNLGVYFLNR